MTATGAETSRRVLPARIRRAAGAGAGAESVRELEEMIVDWLERYGDVDAEPPESLPIVVTTLPLALLSPQPFCVHSQHAEDIIVKVEVEVPDPLAPTAAPAKEAAALIETPSWVLVTAGQDDQMEAREEMSAGPTRSPTKRLRHGVAGSQVC